jgi:hypothetical protein
MHSSLYARAGGGALLLGLLALAAGCTPSYKARATVKGKVTFANKHLTTGNVVFHGKNNIEGAASIDKDGNYVMNDAPLGDVVVTVYVPELPPGGLAMMKRGPAVKKAKDAKSTDPEGSGKSIDIMGTMPSEYVPIPKKYASPSSSGLTYKVEKGEHTFDLNLTP